MTLVSGPIFAIRLQNREGRVIYLFGDHHNDLGYQTECPISSKNSIRIDGFLKRIWLKQPKKKMGMYLEMHQNSTKNPSTQYTYKYIHGLDNLVSDNIRYDAKGKILPSKHFPNVMFHYWDVRDEAPWFSDNQFRYEQLYHNIQSNIQAIHTTVSYMKQHIDNTEKLYKKVIHGPYHNKEMALIIKKHFHNIANAFGKLHEKAQRWGGTLQKLLSRFYKEKLSMNRRERHKFSHKLATRMDRIFTELWNLHSIQTDLYLLRRLLDKPYGTEYDFVYGGTHHMIHIALFLVTQTDFRVTHTTGGGPELFNNLPENTDILRSDVRNQIYIQLTGLDIIHEAGRFVQCVDLSGFPE